MRSNLNEYGFCGNSGYEGIGKVSGIMFNGMRAPVKDGVAVVDAGNSIGSGLTRYAEYLYGFECGTIDYLKGYEFYNGDGILGPMGCTSVRKGNFYGRNYDWFYNDVTTFVMRVKPFGTEVLYGSIGVGAVNSIGRKLVEGGEYSKLYDYIPFMLLDGINENGVVVNTNVVPAQKGSTVGTSPEVEKRLTICSLMIPRYILDHFKSAEEAVNYIRDYASVFNYGKLRDKFHYDIHVMVGDAEKTFVIEFVDNRTVIMDVSDKAYMTNFHLSGVTFNSDGSVYTPYTKSLDQSHDAVEANNVTTLGSGLERYNIINSKYSGLDGYDDMVSLMTSDLRYTNTYRNNDPSKNWYTEGCGEYEGTKYRPVHVNSPIEDCDVIYSVMRGMFEKRKRTVSDTWQTVHTSIYDIEGRKLTVFSQEDTEKSFEFAL